MKNTVLLDYFSHHNRDVSDRGNTELDMVIKNAFFLLKMEVKLDLD